MTGLLLAVALATAPAPQLGAAVAVEQPTRGPVVSVLGDITVRSDVTGDVVALGGSVFLAPGVTVHGDAVALGGRVGGAGRVAGRAVGVGGPVDVLSLAGATGNPAQAFGIGVLRVGVWVTLAALVVLFRPRTARSIAAQLEAQRWRVPLLGAIVLLVWLVAVVLALVVAATPLGIACVLLAVAALLAAKVLGIIGVAWLIGRAAAPRLPLALRGEAARTAAAVFALAAVSLVPVLGSAIWLLANVTGIGAFAAQAAQRRPLAVLVPRLAAR